MNSLFKDGLGFQMPCELGEAVTVLLWQVDQRDELIGVKDRQIRELLEAVKQRDELLKLVWKVVTQKDNSGCK